MSEKTEKRQDENKENKVFVVNFNNEIIKIDLN